MTKAEFAQLAGRTYSFTQLPPEKQNEILALEGEQMEYYVQIFNEENEAMSSAVNDFETQNEKVINEFKATVKKTEAEKLKSDEDAEKKQDEQALNSLLKKI